MKSEYELIRCNSIKNLNKRKINDIFFVDKLTKLSTACLNLKTKNNFYIKFFK